MQRLSFWFYPIPDSCFRFHFSVFCFHFSSTISVTTPLPLRRCSVLSLYAAYMLVQKRGLPFGSPPVYLEFYSKRLNYSRGLVPTWVLSDLLVQSDLTRWDRSKVVFLFENTWVGSLAIDITISIQFYAIEIDWPC